MWNHFGRKEILLQLCVVEGANILDQGVNSSSTAYKESDQIGFSGLLVLDRKVGIVVSQISNFTIEKFSLSAVQICSTDLQYTYWHVLTY